MPTDKKLIAAATHTAEQAKLAWRLVDNAKRSVDRAQDKLAAAEDAVVEAEEKAEAAQREADEAREAASGLSTFVDAQAAEIGMER
jgi:hypothetical protein